MDSQQDLAVNTLTVLDNSGEHALLSMGDAHFKECIKVYGDAHIHKQMRIGGNIIPLSNTISIGTECTPWMNLHCATATIHTLNVQNLNVVNTTSTVAPSDTYTYAESTTTAPSHDCDSESESDYDLKKINLTSATNNYNITIGNHKLTILDLTNLKFSNINYNAVFIKLPTCNLTGTFKKIVIINSNNRDITFDDTNIEYVHIASASPYQIYEFTYIKELHNWIVTFKF